MEVKFNIPDWIKIPLKILIPGAFFLSASLAFLPSNILSRLYLLDWRNEYGFYIGLTFLASTTLIIIYALYYFKSVISDKFFKKRYTLRKIQELNEAELSVIFGLYHSDGYTAKLDLNQPIIKGLLMRSYIYAGGSQLVTANPYTNSLPINCTLQPYVYQALTYGERKLKNRLEKLEKRIQNAKNNQKRERLQSKYNDLEEISDTFYKENSRWIS